MIDTAVVIESIHYLLGNLNKATKLKLLKLVYLADKYHLIRYGRTITGDDYYAMQHGPVGSTTKDVLELNTFTLSEEEFRIATNLFSLETDGKTLISEKNTNPNDLGHLSETDVEALDFVLEQYGKMDAWQLREYTHKFPEWSKHSDLFEKQQIKRERISTEELFSVIPNDPIGQGIDPQHIEESKKVYQGLI